jgi:excisionase family DNA binding protein
MTKTEWLTVEQIASELGVLPQTVRTWLTKGQLRGLLISRATGWRIKREDYEQFLNARMNMPEATGDTTSSGDTEGGAS